METDISNIIFHLMGLGLLLILSAFFSGSETAFFSLSKAQIEKIQQGNGKINKLVTELLSNPRNLLITILVGNTLVNTASASLVTSFATALLGNKGIGIAIGFTTISLLIFGEITPKSIAVRNAEIISKIVAYPLKFFSSLISPIRSIFEFASGALMKLFVKTGDSTDDYITDEELKIAVDIAEEAGSIEQQEKGIINTIFDLKDITAAEIMVPRTEIICVSDESALQHLFDTARLTGHSRIPVYNGDIDHVFGIAYIRDFPILRNYDVKSMTVKEFLESPHGKDVLIRQPFFAPETRTAIGLLQDFREQRVQMAILLDEYGGTAGLVTMRDLVNEIVGEFTNKYGGSSENFRMIDDYTAIVSGRTTIRNVNKRMDLDLPSEEDVDTIGGYVTSLIGHIPSKGETFQDIDLEFKVLSADERRIKEVLIRKVLKEN